MEKQFWDKYAPFYDKFMRKDRAAYAEICALIREKAPWLWSMTWSGAFALTEEQNSFGALRRLYHHPYAVTLDTLPGWLGQG